MYSYYFMLSKCLNYMKSAFKMISEENRSDRIAMISLLQINSTFSIFFLPVLNIKLKIKNDSSIYDSEVNNFDFY